jgi:hypothetical protein
VQCSELIQDRNISAAKFSINPFLNGINISIISIYESYGNGNGWITLFECDICIFPPFSLSIGYFMKLYQML